MSKPLLIGLTGGIGAGKSTVAKIFNILGAPVYYADDKAKFLMNNNQALRSKIVELFGKESYKNDRLDNVHIAKIVFKNPEQLEQLNNLVHPAVKVDFESWVEKQDAGIVIKEAALLYEAGSYKELDKIITVTCPEEIRIKRVLTRDSHRNKADIKRIIAKQWPEEEKVKKSDYVIKNDGSASLIKQCLDLFRELNNSKI